MTSSLTFPGAWPTVEPAPVGDPLSLVDGPMTGGGAVDGDGWSGVCDGEPFAVQRDAHGAYRFLHGDRTLLELSPDRRRLTGSLDAEVRSTRWWRALLDSVLFTAALLRGGEALHAGAVATPRGVLAIAGPSGAGKSTLLAHLVGGRGLDLVTDDILFLRADAGGRVLAEPGPPLMTVPRAVADPPGAPLAELPDERWRATPVAAGPRPLWRVVTLDRHHDGPAHAHPEAAPFPVLMRHLLAFPRTPEREAARLRLAAALAAEVELVRLRAPLTCPVEQVAALALDEFTGLDAPTGEAPPTRADRPLSSSDHRPGEHLPHEP